MRLSPTKRFWWAVTSFSIAALVAGDEVLFLNGDRLTGKIIKVGNGKLILKTESAGKLTIDLEKVKTFSSEEAMTIHVDDKPVFDSKVAAGSPGNVKTDALPEPLAINEITLTNPRAPISAYSHDSVFIRSDHNWFDIDAPTALDYELDDIFTPHTGMFVLPPFVSRPSDWLLEQQARLYEKIGLRIGFAYTHVLQQASGGPGERWASSGDADLMFNWTLVGRGTDHPGGIFFSVEERFRAFADITPSEMRSQIGSLVNVGGPFNNRGAVVRDLFWDQYLFDGKLRMIGGRGAPDDYVGAHRLQSVNFGFFNGNLAGNVTMPFPGHGPLAVVSVRPTDLFYATAGGANAYSTTTQISVDELFEEGRIFGFGEVGFTPKIRGLDRGRFAITGWNMPGRELWGLPSDWGINFTIEQYLSDRLWVYGRYGYSDGGLNGVKSGYSAALAIDGLLGSPDNVTGIGFGYVVPSNSSLRDEKSMEIFHRFQVTKHSQMSLGAQLIMNPSNAPDTDAAGVFSFRFRVVL